MTLATTVAAATAAVAATMSFAVLNAILIGWSRVAMLTTVAATAMQMTAHSGCSRATLRTTAADQDDMNLTWERMRILKDGPPAATATATPAAA